MRPIDPFAAEFVYRIYDPSFYIAIDFAQNSPLALLGKAPQPCSIELRPAPTTLDPTLRANIVGAHPLPDGLLLVLDLDAVTAPCPTAPEKEHLS